MKWPFYATPRPVVPAEEAKPRTIAFGTEAMAKAGINPTVPTSHFIGMLGLRFPAVAGATIADKVCRLTITFGDTEIHASAQVVKTGQEVSTTFSFMSPKASGAETAADGIGGAEAVGHGAGVASGRSVTPAAGARPGGGW